MRFINNNALVTELIEHVQREHNFISVEFEKIQDLQTSPIVIKIRVGDDGFCKMRFTYHLDCRGFYLSCVPSAVHLRRLADVLDKAAQIRREAGWD